MAANESRGPSLTACVGRGTHTGVASVESEAVALERRRATVNRGDGKKPARLRPVFRSLRKLARLVRMEVFSQSDRSTGEPPRIRQYERAIQEPLVSQRQRELVLLQRDLATCFSCECHYGS